MEDEEEMDPQEALQKVHRKERQELQDKIQALKKTASKGDKKKKKEINAEIAKLEGDLNEKQSAELMDLMLNEVTLKEEADIVDTEHKEEIIETVEKEERVSKAQKRRDRKAEKQKQRLEEIEAQEQENLLGTRHREQEKIKELLESRGLKLVEIASDGDCMFAGLVHQLSQYGESSSVSTLRQQCGAEILRNKETYRPFLSHPRTGEMLTDEQFQEYCSTISNTSVWGGQVELRALSSVLHRPLEVVQAEGQETVLVGDQEIKPKLTLTYHRHMYGLGEHYNSTTNI